MPNSKAPPRPGEVVMSAEEIAEVVSRLGREISTDYAARRPILVNLLKGAVVFLADLIRELTIPHQIDFLSVSSYEKGTSSSGVVRIVQDLNTNIEGKDIILVEDVLDTGQTLAYIVDILRLRAPRTIEVCTLLRKRKPQTREIPVRYLGKEIQDVFVVGYGLDYEERFRNLRHIARLEIDGDV